MDETTLNALRDALAASPDNSRILGLLLKAYGERGEAAEAYRALTSHQTEFPETEDDRLLAAAVCIGVDRREEALQFLDDPAPAVQVEKARILVALGRHGEARALYDEAIAANPTLDDPALKAEFDGKVVRLAVVGGTGDRHGHDNDTGASAPVTPLTVPKGERITFADIAGLTDIKDQINRRIIMPFQKPSLYQRFRKKVGGGVLMYGPPGVGKTMLARATAGECNAAFINVTISDVLDMYVGESERKLHELFEQARRKTPAVIFFDEIEALGGKRQNRQDESSSKLVSQFLSEMDGFAQNNDGVLILGATNLPWAVDPAFRRPGRFDRVVFIPPPDAQARAAILELQLADRPVAKGVDIKRIAEACRGYSGADIRNLVDAAADRAIDASIDSDSVVEIDTNMLSAALKEINPTTLEWLTTARNYARYANEGGQYDAVLEFLDRHGR